MHKRDVHLINDVSIIIVMNQKRNLLLVYNIHVKTCIDSIKKECIINYYRFRVI